MRPDSPARRAAFLLSRETEQLGRMADRLKEGRRVLAFIACPTDLVKDARDWLSSAAARDIPTPEAEGADALFERIVSAAGGDKGLVVSMAWKTGDRDAVATINLHREKLRRGASVLVWVDPEDLLLLQTEAQDAYAFRDTAVIIEGFRAPEIPAPPDNTEELRLLRARQDLPGGPAEKALWTADLVLALIRAGQLKEAFQIGMNEVKARFEDLQGDAANATLAYLAATLAASMAASGVGQLAWRWAEAAVVLRRSAGDSEQSLSWCLAGFDPLRRNPLPFALLLVDKAERWAERNEIPASPLLARTLAETGWHTGNTRDTESWGDSASLAIVQLARGDLREAISSFARAAESPPEDWIDPTISWLCAAETWVSQGEERAASEIIRACMRTRNTSRVGRAMLLGVLAEFRTLAGDPRRALQLGWPPGKAWFPGDAALYRRCAARAALASFAAECGRLSTPEIEKLYNDLDMIQDQIPTSKDVPPFYRILFPRLRAMLLTRIPERREEAIRLAEEALDRARREHLPYLPDCSVTLVGCLLAACRDEEAYSVIVSADPQAEETGHLRALAALRAHRVAILARHPAGIGAFEPESPHTLDEALSALGRVLRDTGSPRIAAETWLSLARALPPDCHHPDPLALAEAQIEPFSEMPMPGNVALALETKGDVLAHRGQIHEATLAYTAAEKKARHYGLLLRVPLLQGKRAKIAS